MTTARSRRDVLALAAVGLVSACASTAKKSATAATTPPTAATSTPTTTTPATTTVVTSTTALATTAETTPASTTAVTATPTTASASPASCTLTPEQTEGPYYLPLDNVRRDITDGHPGAPLTLRIKVLDVNGCAPKAGASVDVWHCDAAGAYSGVTASTRGQSFLRGTQVTAADGTVEFATIYPGWYPGRTTHIHVKVRDGKTPRHIGQLFFPDDVTAQVYARAPYATRGKKDTTNQGDSIFRAGGASPLVTVTADATANGFTADVVTTVRS
jgi:protocatechuate 3,4-dioxygenase beta subunit